MHELTIATDIVENVLQFAEAHQVGEVIKVRLRIGEFTGVAPEQLHFCYNSIVNETPLQNSILEIETIAASITCPGCGFQGTAVHWSGPERPAVATLQCPRCGKTAKPATGNELRIQGIQCLPPERWTDQFL